MMSLGKRTPLGVAQNASKTLTEVLESSCEKIIVVGSVRRCKEMVGDIEIVALAHEDQFKDLFGAAVSTDRTSIDNALDQFKDIETHGWRVDPRAKGKVVKRLRHIETSLTADIYVVTDRRAWGSHVVIRTGPQVFSKKVVTVARAREMHFANGFLLHNHPKGRTPCRTDCHKIIPLPHEIDVFEQLKITYLSPEEREKKWGTGI